jgi:superfamily II RNA helicase
MHLLAHHNPEQREQILKSNFDYFVRRQEGSHVRIMASFNNKVKTLTKMEYLTPEGKLTWKGAFLLQVYANELVLGEIFGTELQQQFDEIELCLLISAIVFEERKNMHFKMAKHDPVTESIVKKLAANQYALEHVDKFTLKRLSLLVTCWASGAEFTQLLDYTELPEGDIVHFFLRISDAMRQLRHATQDESLKERLLGCLKRMYRDVVRVNL